MAVAEVNINWRVVGKRENLHSLTSTWFENSRAITSNNMITSTKFQHQQGGTAIITAGDTSVRVVKSYRDKHNMGRWCSTKFQAKQNHIFRVVSVYVPQDKKQNGDGSVFEQQQAALLKTKRCIGVMDAFWKDFWSEIDTWLEAGELLLIGGDWNQDVYCNNLKNKFEKGILSQPLYGHTWDVLLPHIIKAKIRLMNFSVPKH